ncbi:MAG: leucine-rich repeat domain-containing protein [Ruminococcaceae bacterium]|nr:leucine-rich repeat domain-containing protein [Oscillospiraceae bacterium]
MKLKGNRSLLYFKGVLTLKKLLSLLLAGGLLCGIVCSCGPTSEEASSAADSGTSSAESLSTSETQSNTVSSEGESKPQEGYEFVVDVVGELKKYNGTGGEVVFPETAKKVENSSFFLTTNFTSVTLSKNFYAAKRSTSIYDFPLAGLASLNMQIPLQKAGKTFDEIKVHKENPNFQAVDGVLYTSDMTTLILYPQGKKDKTFRVPDGVVYIADGAFLNCWNLENVTLPVSLEYISKYAFTNCKKLEAVKYLGKAPEVVLELCFAGTPYYRNYQNEVPVQGSEIPPPYPYEDRVFTNADLPTLTIDDLWWHLNAWDRRGMWRKLTICDNIQHSYFVKRNGNKIIDGIIIDKSCEVEMPDGSIEYIDQVGNVISIVCQDYEYVGVYERVLNANSLAELNEEMDRYFTGDAHNPIVPVNNNLIEVDGKLYFQNGEAGWIGAPDVTSLEMIGDDCLRANAPYLGDEEGPHPNTHYFYFVVVDGKLKMSQVEQVYD